MSDYEPGLYTTIGLLPATISATPESTVVANGISASLFTFMLEIGCSRFRIASLVFKNSPRPYKCCERQHATSGKRNARVSFFIVTGPIIVEPSGEGLFAIPHTAKNLRE
ncbi:MAG TPA: hypothetical protein PLE48_12365 [Thiobacillus sp.]|nr:hypothetical protein [Thiobacillus sp.]HQT71203.1 hypothetical protein [Thiobacillus sp.]